MVTTTVTTNAVTIDKALSWAHDVMMNRHALNKGDCEEIGVTEQNFTEWCNDVEELREKCKPALVLQESITADEKETTKALTEVKKVWRNLCKKYANFNETFFVRNRDAQTLVDYALRHATITARGRVWAPKGQADFRRDVEILIGIRMSGNAVLTDEQRDVITTYEKAVKTIKSKENQLKDTVIQGKKADGLRTKAESARKRLASQEALLDQYGIIGEQKESMLSAFRNALSEANTAVSDAEKAIEAAKKLRDENEDKYNKTIALVKSIGCIL